MILLSILLISFPLVAVVVVVVVVLLPFSQEMTRRVISLAVSLCLSCFG